MKVDQEIRITVSEYFGIDIINFAYLHYVHKASAYDLIYRKVMDLGE